MSRMSSCRKAPFHEYAKDQPGAEPASVFRHIARPIQPRHPVPTALLKRLRKCPAPHFGKSRPIGRKVSRRNDAE